MPAEKSPATTVPVQSISELQPTIIFKIEKVDREINEPNSKLAVLKDHY